MIAQREKQALKLAGSKRQQELAGKVLGLLQARGMFMAANSPIRVSLSALTDFLERQGDKSSAAFLQSAAEANPDVFAIEIVDDEPFIVTTRDGVAPSQVREIEKHSFAARFFTPLPKTEGSAVARSRPRPRDPVVDALVGMELTGTVEEAATDVAAAVEPDVEEAPTILARIITTQVIKPTDVTQVDDLNLAVALRNRLGADPRVANFGEQWLMEDRVPRFSRGDLRRLRDYMQEKEQPLTDDDLTQDVLGVRPGAPDFELVRFGIDYRLSNEHREFEFVGTGSQRFWSTSGLPQIGTTRRKLNEIGTDFRFLLDEEPELPAHRTRESVDHTLTFYEFIHGLLPYDAEMQALLLGPVVPGQKSAVLTFECPQSFTTYLVELRFPTPNRGGFILGLDDFYTENLVPGAVISIQRTENDGHYRVEYVPEAPQSNQLLELDERRALRYVFRPTTFACGVDNVQLLSEERFAGLANEKPLDEKIRRRPETVVAATFERIGDARDANFSAEFQTLLAGVNVERPMSATLLRSILEQDDTGAFSRDPDVADSYTYVPGRAP
ncbi:MAG: hypothetical protein M3Q50_08225 [Chloroflexota bacterium]|nr:hypothetical protein [Chloroflexota bacterium]